jgi:parallel beta-helix repeat protein
MSNKVTPDYSALRKMYAIILAVLFVGTAGFGMLADYSFKSDGGLTKEKAVGYGTMDPGGVPHYFGPYGNYANSPVPTGSISSITVDAGGSGYTAPTVDIIDVWGTGSGASATATVSGGVITDITLISGGTGYSAPIVAITDPTGADAAASAVLDGALSGGIRKFVDSLPGLGEANANNLGNYIDLAVPDTATYPGCDYYEIAVVQYVQKMHTDLPPTLLRGYVQLETPFNSGVSKHVALQNPDGTAILKADGTQAYAVDNPHYLGASIVAQRDTPVRIKFSNLLPTGAGGDLFLPVDSTVMGAGMGALAIVEHIMVTNGGSGYTTAPGVTLTGGGGTGAMAEAMVMGGMVHHVMVMDGGTGYTSAPTVSFTGGGGSGATADSMIMYENYTENRATLHLHGGFVPWISDGTPHQWTTPAGETTQYPKGVSVQYVPDMWFVNGHVVPNTIGQTTAPVPGASNNPGDGSLTFYYNNQQSARLMFYHDHSYGITRLNVYAGEAAAYLLTDSVEEDLINSGVVPSLSGEYRYGIPLVIQDKSFVDASTIPYQDPTWAWGSKAPGTPSTGDLWLPHVYMPNQNPWDASGMNAWGRWHYGPWFWPPTIVKQGPVPNPYYDPINAPWEPPMMPGVPTNSMAMEAFMDTPTVNGAVYPYMNVEPQSYRFRVLSVGNDRFFNLQWYVADSSVVTSDGRTNTEVKMVPAEATPDFPELWPTDGREGGVPDPSTIGPSWIQIGTEGGFLPAPTVIDNQPVAWNLNPTTFNMGNVQDYSLLLGPAERADVIVDFSEFAGKTLILYNDAPAAFPARDPRYDYFTGNADQTSGGGAPTTQPGYGPNMRTIMQVRVANITPAPAYDLAALNAAFAKTSEKAGVFESSQDPIIVPQAAYNSAYDMSFPEDNYVRIMDSSMTFTTISGTTLTIPFEMKAIQDEMGEAFDTDYGRMSGMLGLELPLVGGAVQNFMMYGFASPPVDVVMTSLTAGEPVAGDGTQLWKITHNGVDTHTLHTHLYSMQLINRVAWDNSVMPPDPNELGWKETLRVNPLEDTIVAIRPVAPTQPFEIPNSVRPIDPTMPLGAVLTGPPPGFQDPAANPVTVTNHLVNFGWEYVMHCHLLGHEEMDMMHGVSVAVPPFAPQNLGGILFGSFVGLSWTDGSIAETGYIIQRSTVPSVWNTIAEIPSPLGTTGPTTGTVMYYLDTIVADGTVYSYRVLANKVVGDTEVYLDSIGFPTASANSTPSNEIVVDTGTGIVMVLPAPVGAPNNPPAPGQTGPDAPLPLALPSITPTLQPAAYTPSAPIRIDSNADFDAAHGVSAGDGSLASPWIIEGLSIDGSGSSYGIYIGNTTDHFIVRDSYMSDAAGDFRWKYSPDAGIVLNNVTNGIVANNILMGNAWAGIYLHMTQGVALMDNQVSGSRMGAYLRLSSGNILAGNSLWENYAGIWLYESDANLITNNMIARNQPGVHMAKSDGNLLYDNSIYGNAYYGLWLSGSNSNGAYGNDFVSNNGAASVRSDAHVQAYDAGAGNLWNGTSAGNHWSDWVSPDANSDGIVDVPYLLGGGAGAMDHYPIVAVVKVQVLTTILVTPSPVSVVRHSTEAFAADGYSQYGLLLIGLTFSWSTDLGTMTDNLLTAQAAVGTVGYVRATSGLVEGDAIVTVVIGPLAYINVTPAAANVVVGDLALFSAYGTDAYYNVLSGLVLSWSTNVGAITGFGLFTAQLIPGVVGYVNANVGAITGSSVVTITYAPLNHMVVSPGTANVAAGGTQTFTVDGYDQYNNLIPGLTISWSTTIGTMTGSVLAAQTTAGVMGAVLATSGYVMGFALVTVVPAALDYIDLAPSTVNVVAGSQTMFFASGKDVYNNPIPGLVFSWTTDVGSIDSSGLLTAQTTPGVSGHVYASVGFTTGGAVVNVISLQPLTMTIVVTPGLVSVAAGTTQAFSAAAYDQNGALVPGVTFAWSSTVGTMTNNVLTASTVAGASGYVTAMNGTAFGQAFVTIVPDVLSVIDVLPASSNVPAGSQAQFTATGKDAYGNVISGLTFVWSATLGTVTQTGLFTAPTTAPATGSVSATSSTITGSATVNVLVNSLASIVVTPTSADVVAGTVQSFTAIGYDLFSNPIPGLAFTWATNVGTIVDGTLTAQALAGVSGYVRATSGAIFADALVNIVPGALDQIDLTPATLSAAAGTQTQFTAVGKDVLNNPIAGLSFIWTSTVGTVSGTGLFTAPPVAGSTGTVSASVGAIAGSAAVTITTGQLAYILVTPITANVAAGATTSFSAVGYDAQNNVVSGVAFTWSTDVGTMTGNSFQAQAVSGITGYVRATSGLVSGDAVVTIVPGALDHILVAPATLTVAAGTQTQMSATGYDAFNNMVPGLTFSWTTDVGTVSASGLFTAQLTAGASGAIVATVGLVSGTATVTITPGQLAQIVVTPATVNVVAGASQAFSAAGFDQYGNAISGIAFTWATNVGTMSGSVLTAQTISGITGHVTATSSAVVGTSLVTILSGPLDHIVVTPNPASVVAGAQKQFTAIGRDAYNNAISGLTFSWATDVGTVDGSGLFTAQATGGVTGYVGATSGLVTGSASVTVTAVVANSPPVLTPLVNMIVRVGTTVTLTGNAVDADLDPIRYTWRFGDGTPMAVGKTVTHVYTRAGIFTLTLWADDLTGLPGHNVSSSAKMTVPLYIVGSISPNAVTDPVQLSESTQSIVSSAYSGGSLTELAIVDPVTHVYTTYAVGLPTRAPSVATGGRDTSLVTAPETPTPDP